MENIEETQIEIRKEKPKFSLKLIINKINIFKSMADGDILDKAIKKVIYILVVLIPLWFLPITLDAIELNKQALMVLLVVIALILWSVKILNRGEIRWRSSILNISLGVFAIICILATFFSIRPYSSLMGWPDHLSGSLINILCFVALYFLIVNNFKGSKEVFGLLFAFLASSVLIGIIGLLQIWGKFIFPWDFTKTISFNTVGSINFFGIFSSTILTLVTSLLFVVKRRGIKLFLLLLGLLNLIILININFWALWVILAVGMVFILVFGLMQIVQSSKDVSWIALPIILLAIALIFILFKPAFSFQPNLPIEVGLSYKGGLSVVENTIKNKPILGSGLETFIFDYAKYKPEGINQTAFWNVKFTNPPAEIYSIASESGILGLISFLAVIIIFIFKIISNTIKEKEENNGLKRFLNLGLLSGWMGLAVGWFIYPQNFVLMFTFWLLFALYVAGGLPLKEKVFDLRKSPKILLAVSFSFIVIIILIISFLYVEGTRFVAEVIYKNGVNLIQAKGDIDNGINKIIRSTIINPYEDNTYKALSQLFVLKLNRDAALTDITQEEKVNLVQVDAANAINSVVQATRLSPKDASNWLLRGRVYRGLMSIVNGAADWAENAYNEALKIEPSNPFTYLELGRLDVNRADATEDNAQKNEYLINALKNLDKAIALKSNYAPAHFEEAVIYDKQGKSQEAIAKMEINLKLLPNDSGAAFQLGVLYYKNELYDKAKAAFIKAISIEDNFSNARYFLGLLYDKDGKGDEAIKQFEKIAELNPDNEQVKQILANLRSGKPALGSPELGPPEQPENIPID
ncbi:tetratricopeptide repeat protein [Patescibacteria group bacterium]|nr:tetratricopeptide repeat protein [Patescibacteria group bacterium]MBU4458770.1 tetratricopeptide repeat protein [Patescibacteria group bacterium]MCG2696071.1 tetratricopeptide repeat protein [Candidatus Portnoybacteria bacterium]